MKNYAKKAAICQKATEAVVGVPVGLVDVVFYDPLFEGEPRGEAFVFRDASGRDYEMDIHAAHEAYYPAIPGLRGCCKFPPEPWELEVW